MSGEVEVEVEVEGEGDKEEFEVDKEGFEVSKQSFERLVGLGNQALDVPTCRKVGKVALSSLRELEPQDPPALR